MYNCLFCQLLTSFGIVSSFPVLNLIMTKAAVTDAIYGAKPEVWQPKCPDRVCIFPGYWALAACSTCRNVTTQWANTRTSSTEFTDWTILADKIISSYYPDPADSTFQYYAATNEDVYKSKYGLPVTTTSQLNISAGGITDDALLLNTVIQSATALSWSMNLAQPLSDWLVNDTVNGMYADVKDPLIAFGYLRLDGPDRPQPPTVLEGQECAINICARHFDTMINGTNISSTASEPVYGTYIARAANYNGDHPWWYNFDSWSVIIDGHEVRLFDHGPDGSSQDFWTIGVAVYEALLGTRTDVVRGYCQAGSPFTTPASQNKCGSTNIGYNNSNIQGSDVFDFLESAEASGKSFPDIIDQVAAAITKMLNQNGDVVVIGEVLVPEVFVQVRWPWLVLPAMLILLGAFTLLFTAYATSRKRMAVWKTSTYPLIYCGPLSSVLHPGTAGCGEDLVSRMAVSASQTSISMRRDEGSGPWRLR